LLIYQRVLIETEQKVLERGLNFSIAPCKATKFEITQITKSIERAAVKLAPEKAERYRGKFKAALEKCKRFRRNMTKTEK
jgi:hypothetical protein